MTTASYCGTLALAHGASQSVGLQLCTRQRVRVTSSPVPAGAAATLGARCPARGTSCSLLRPALSLPHLACFRGDTHRGTALSDLRSAHHARPRAAAPGPLPELTQIRGLVAFVVEQALAPASSVRCPRSRGKASRAEETSAAMGNMFTQLQDKLAGGSKYDSSILGSCCSVRSRLYHPRKKAHVVAAVKAPLVWISTVTRAHDTRPASQEASLQGPRCDRHRQGDRVHSADTAAAARPQAASAPPALHVYNAVRFRPVVLSVTDSCLPAPCV